MDQLFADFGLPPLEDQARGRADCYVPYLGPDLWRVPPEPVHRHQATRAQLAAEWVEWRAGVLRMRREIRATLAQLTGSDLLDYQEALKKACAEDWGYFVAVACWVFEPRSSAKRSGGWVEFVPLPTQIRQVRYLQWMLTQEGRFADVLYSKSRDVGATWIVAMVCLAGFLFADPFVAKIVSRREDEVGKRHQPDAVMTRIVDNLRKIKDDLPFLLPPGFDPDKNQRDLLIFRHDNSNNIHGESTAPGSTGRGGRCTLAVVDEGAFVRGFGEIWATLGMTTDHRVGISSESLEYGIEWYEACNDETGTPVVAIEWWQHPWHDDEWYDLARRRYGKETAKFAREVDRDPLAEGEDLVYPQMLQRGTVAEIVGSHRYDPNSGWDIFVCIDPGRDDEQAMHWLTRNPSTGRYILLESYDRAHQPPEFYAALLMGNLDPDFAPWIGPREKLLVEWVRTLPWPKYVYGDPAGKSKTHDEDDKKSWFGRMEEYAIGRGYQLYLGRWQKNLERAQRTRPDYAPPRPRKRAFGVITKTKDDARFIMTRRAMMMTLFKVLDFNDTPDVRRTVQALREVRFEKHHGQQPAMSEKSGYAHTWRAHLAAALEYFAVNAPDIAAGDKPRGLKKLDPRQRRIMRRQKVDVARLSAP